MSDFKAKKHRIRLFAGAPPQTQLDELTIAPQTLVCIWGVYFEEKEMEEKVKGEEDEVEGGIWPTQKLA